MRIGERRYSSELLQVGLELPCKLIFIGKSKEVQKVKPQFAIMFK